MLVGLRAVLITSITSNSGARGIVGGDGETLLDEQGGLHQVDGGHIPPDGLVLLGVLELQNGGLGGRGGQLDGDTATVGVDLPVLVVGTILFDGNHVAGGFGGGPEVDGLAEVVDDVDTGAAGGSGGLNDVGGGAGDNGRRGGPGGGHDGGGLNERAGGRAGRGDLNSDLDDGLAGRGGDNGSLSGGRLSDNVARVDGDPFDLGDNVDNNSTLVVVVGVTVGVGRDHTGQGGEAESSDDAHSG